MKLKLQPEKYSPESNLKRTICESCNNEFYQPKYMPGRHYKFCEDCRKIPAGSRKDGLEKFLQIPGNGILRFKGGYLFISGERKESFDTIKEGLRCLEKDE